MVSIPFSVQREHFYIVDLLYISFGPSTCTGPMHCDYTVKQCGDHARLLSRSWMYFQTTYFTDRFATRLVEFI